MIQLFKWTLHSEKTKEEKGQKKKKKKKTQWEVA